jgi:hypothetical protein
MRNEERRESMNAPQIFETARDASNLRIHLPAAVLYKKLSPSIVLQTV